MNAAIPTVAVALCLLTTPWAWADPQNQGYTGAALGFTDDSNTDDRHKVVAKLTVRGDAQLHKPADQLRLNVGVVTEATQAGEALQENSRRMVDVVEALEEVGLTKGEYETGQFHLQPQYSRRPRQAGPEWRPQIIGYQVTNTLSIKTKRLDLAGELIEAANQAGANSIGAIGFELADPRTHRAEAIAAATANALADAHTLADAASVQLVRIITITLDEAAHWQPIRTMAARAGPALAEAAVPPPIVPGKITVRAGVTVIYEIATKNESP
ncbi:MAG: SIMPL domain-containing protein [Planctomycetota bacterium]|nr:SIMPL domain-containing protein [Planctomycetota bacterium]